MAKAKTNTAIATLDQFTIGGNLDVNDVLSVVTSKAETRYAQEVERCRNGAKALGKEQERLRSEINKLIEEEATGPHRKTEKTLQETVKPFGGKVTLLAQTGHLTLPLTDDGLLSATLTIVSSRGGYNATATFCLTAKPSKTLLKLGEDFDKNNKAIADLNAEAVDWKRKLNNIPMLERHYRAQIATAKLKTSDDGQKLLDMLTDGLDDTILTLPGC